ncbi:hypothetical protein WJX77_000145 [Trebouxia sp. C0004]
MLHIAASESLEQFGMTNLFPPFIPSHQPLPKPATNLTEAAARAEADTRGIGQPAARPSPRQDVSLSGGTMPHVPTAAVHTGLVSKGYRAPNLGGVCAVTADSSSPQSVAQLEATVSVNPGGKSAQARVSCNTPPLARGDPRAGGSPVVQRLLHESADPLSACAGDWQGPAGTGKPSGVTSIRPTCDPQAGKPLADSSRTPFPPGRGNLQHSKPADDPINRPAVATRIPNALFRSAPQITVPRQVSIPAASQLSKPGLVELSELGKTTKQILALHHFLLLFFLTASLQLGQSLLLLASHAVAVSVPFLHTGKAAVSRGVSPRGAEPGGCSKPWGSPRGAKGSKGTGFVLQEKVAKNGAMPEQARMTGPQTGHDSLTHPPPLKSSSSVPASTHFASPHSASQMDLSHELSPPKLDQLPSELPLKQSMTLQL